MDDVVRGLQGGPNSGVLDRTKGEVEVIRMPQAPEQPAPPVTALIVGMGHESDALVRGLDERGIAAESFWDRAGLERRMDTIVGELVIVGGHPSVEDAWPILNMLAEREEPALFLSPTMDQDTIDQALAEGATDVLPPPHSPESVAFRAHVVARRDVPTGLKEGGRSEVRAGPLTIDLRTGLAKYDGQVLSLSRREFDLLSGLAQAGGEVVQRESLIETIWGADVEAGAAVLDTTVHRLRRKLKSARCEAPDVRTVRGIGYRLEIEGE